MKLRNITSGVIFVLYALIMLEGILMAAPFAEVDRGKYTQQMFTSELSIRDRLWGTESNKVKVAFGKTDKPGKQFVPLNEIMDMSVRSIPVLVADLDLTTGEIFNVIQNSKHQYGNTPQPIF